ncbi:hypothetical protein M3650_27015 [Paenibacillus sp. MER TA 81-3]|uniref:hypothetical protein n=1 Tax=Paenibacillus sp. MER TA 81-3 TaxID=2939573 RepID=UPI00203F5D48|nr:hypothetical protein [Paenibacillus sp. MER TA 81-3]MCM3342172.1 hypothetical protein [Paenibacillus sp. MER TA 81-3]
MNYKLTSKAEEISKSEELLYEVLFKPIGLDQSARQLLKIPGDEYHFVAMEEDEVTGVMLEENSIEQTN